MAESPLEKAARRVQLGAELIERQREVVDRVKALGLVQTAVYAETLLAEFIRSQEAYEAHLASLMSEG